MGHLLITNSLGDPVVWTGDRLRVVKGYHTYWIEAPRQAEQRVWSAVDYADTLDEAIEIAQQIERMLNGDVT